LDCKVKFSRSFPSNAKSLVKHLLTADLSKRYGNLSSGPDEIKYHRWWDNLVWDDIFEKKVQAPFKPQINGPNDTSNFEDWPDNVQNIIKVESNMDPFADFNWFYL